VGEASLKRVVAVTITPTVCSRIKLHSIESTPVLSKIQGRVGEFGDFWKGNRGEEEEEGELVS